MLGSYAIKLPTSLLTGKRTQASSACPELARAGNGVRWAVLQEPEKTDVINVGLLKELSGNDTFFARRLHENGREVHPMFKLACICNDKPKLPNNDQAAWNRIRVFPFESTFTSDAPNTFEEQLRQKKFPKDGNFRDKIPDMIEAFAWYLLDYRKKNLHKKKVIPDKVLMATRHYQKSNDIYRQFIEECIKEDKKSQISVTEIYNVFNEWYKESGLPFSAKPIRNDVREYFEKLWGESKKGVIWPGYKIRTIGEQDDESGEDSDESSDESGEDSDESSDESGGDKDSGDESGGDESGGD